jgi:Rod binding domain-containing protein
MRIEDQALHDQAVKLAQPQLDALKKATNGFESIFIKSLMTEMEKGTHMFGTGPGSDIYQDLTNQTLADNVGKRGSLGIGKMLYNQLSPRIVAQAEAQIKLHPEKAQPGKNETSKEK